MPDQEQMETMQERMEQLEKEAATSEGEEAPPVLPALVPVSTMMAAILPRKAGDLLFFLSGGKETAVHVDRIMFICEAPAQEDGGQPPAVIRYDMEHDGKRITELVTDHTIEQLREALQK